MRGYTAAQIRAAEAPLLQAGVPLMQRAATALAQEVHGLLDDRSTPIETADILVLAGAGNNGGDALYAAGRLADAGASVVIIPTAAVVHETGLAAAEDAGATLPVHVAAPASDLVCAARAAAQRSDAIIDGVLGTGTRLGAQAALHGTAREVVAAVIGAIANLTIPRPAVVAVDIPSGINPDTGEVPDPTVLKADLTVTFGAAKAGLLQPPGSEYVGELSVVDIGLVPELADVTPAFEG